MGLIPVSSNYSSQECYSSGLMCKIYSGGEPHLVYSNRLTWSMRCILCMAMCAGGDNCIQIVNVGSMY